MKRSITLFLVITSLKSFAQYDSTYTQAYLEKSTKFAWLTLGAELFTEPGGTAQFIDGGILRETSFQNAITPRLTIGGIHFWGYTDFYVTFPLNFASIRDTPSEFETLEFRQGIETGARFYPLKLQPGRVSPFAGISFNTTSYRQELNGTNFSEGTPLHQQVVGPLEFGLTYTTDNYLITASAYYRTMDDFNYSLSAGGEVGVISPDPMSFSLRVYKYWDTDRHMRQPKVVRRLNRMHDILEEENKLSAWYWGIGPSAAIQLSKSSYLQNNFPYLYNDRIGGFMPDITFGRFFARPDMNLGVSYRTLGHRLRGFDTEIKLRRHSFMFEAYKNLFDYLGFVPYLGITASVEDLRAEVNGTEYQQTKGAVGLIFGWDIRVTNTGTSLLRTNLRWTPNLHLDVEGDEIMFDHLEFNFIQYVHFIGRKKAYAKYSK